MKKHALLALVLLGCVACSNAVGQPAEPVPDAARDPAVAELGSGFRSAHADVHGTRLHYVHGGEGPAVLLVHGFPEDWFAYREIMPRLAERFRVIAVDLRGIGGSRATEHGYDAASLAEDLRQLLERLELERVYVVGHDVGGFAAYMLARQHRPLVRGAMLLESPLPGIGPWNELKCDPGVWHFGFHQTPRLPERMIAGREFIYLREGFLTSESISDAEVAHYARSYAAPDHLHAGLGFYRELPESERVVAAQTEPTDVPFVFAGADRVFAPLMPELAENVRARGASDVTVETIANSGHYVLDDQPEAVLELIQRYASR